MRKKLGALVTQSGGDRGVIPVFFRRLIDDFAFPETSKHGLRSLHLVELPHDGGPHIVLAHLVRKLQDYTFVFQENPLHQSTL
jgi:hypothetical protein